MFDLELWLIMLPRWVYTLCRFVAPTFKCLPSQTLPLSLSTVNAFVRTAIHGFSNPPLLNIQVASNPRLLVFLLTDQPTQSSSLCVLMGGGGRGGGNLCTLDTTHCVAYLG